MDWIKFSPPTGSGEHTYQRATIPVKTINADPIAAAIRAVQDIVDRYPKPYTLMVSGGIDSQAMVWAWMLSGHEFEILTGSYQGMNDHDIKSVKEFLSAWNLDVKVTYKELDVINFLEVEYPIYANTYNCSSPHICTHMKLVEDIEGTVIFAGNYLSPEEKGGATCLTYAILGIDRFRLINKRSIVPFFFLHTDELACSFFQHISTGSSTYDVKINAYQSAGFPVIPQITKLTGFEKIKDYYDSNETVSVKDRIQYSSKASKRVFDLKFRYPFEKKIRDPKLVFDFAYPSKKEEQ